MGRKRWTPERQRTLKEADWIVGWLRSNCPANTRHLVIAMQTIWLDVRALVINKALRRSPFIVHCGHQENEGSSLSLWDFDRTAGEEE